MPVDLRVLPVLKGSALALDIYNWLVYRLSYLKKSTVFGMMLAISLPLAFFSGWLADLSQIRPVLMQLGHAQQKTGTPPVSGSQEPPTGIPELGATWGNSQVLLTWTRVAGAKTYTIYRSMGDLGYSHAQAIGQLSQSASKMAFADFSLTPGHRYTYWVAAGNRAGLGPISQALTGRTFFSTSVIAHRAEEAAIPVQAQMWSQGGMGLLVPADHRQTAMAFNIHHVLYTPLYLSPAGDLVWETSPGSPYFLFWRVYRL